MENSEPLHLGFKHFLTGGELNPGDLIALLDLAEKLKQERAAGKLKTSLQGKTLALLFEKPSLRTHFSFSIAMKELGGDVVESFSINRKKEEPEDVVRVLNGYCSAAMVRTFEHSLLDRMVTHSAIPIINGLTDSHHPCQILADLLTLKQVYGKTEGLRLSYIGDGTNILHSLLLMAPKVGVSVSFACPQGYGPDAFILKKSRALAKETSAKIEVCSNPIQAVKDSNAIYTDTWVSMGLEDELTLRRDIFSGYQVNAELRSHAAKDAVLMHCLSMVRGNEITDEMVEHPRSVIFRQSENRLHVQKALLFSLLSKGKSK